MKYDRRSIDYQINILSLNEMEEVVPMTLEERNRIRGWVKHGHPLDSNPWNYLDGDGYQLNFLQAFRLHYGYSSGPWDSWKGPDAQGFWNDDLKRFLRRDEI